MFENSAGTRAFMPLCPRCSAEGVFLSALCRIQGEKRTAPLDGRPCLLSGNYFIVTMPERYYDTVMP